MVRNAIALALVSMISLSGPALAADAQVSAQKATVAKADSIQRAAAAQKGSQAAGDMGTFFGADGNEYDVWIWLTFGVLVLAVTAAAWSDDEEPSS